MSVTCREKPGCIKPDGHAHPDHYVIRQKSANGQPAEPPGSIVRTCVVCEASYMGLALTDEHGLWGGPTGWSWFCSVECQERGAQ